MPQLSGSKRPAETTETRIATIPSATGGMIAADMADKAGTWYSEQQNKKNAQKSNLHNPDDLR